jgi:hypothetical protein
VQVLLEAGADVNKKSAGGQTFLQAAANSGHEVEIAQVLRESAMGCNVNDNDINNDNCNNNELYANNNKGNNNEADNEVKVDGDGEAGEVEEEQEVLSAATILAASGVFDAKKQAQLLAEREALLTQQRMQVHRALHICHTWAPLALHLCHTWAPLALHICHTWLLADRDRDSHTFLSPYADAQDRI